MAQAMTEDCLISHNTTIPPRPSIPRARGRLFLRPAVQAAFFRSSSVLATLWWMGFHSAFWNSAATETGR